MHGGKSTGAPWGGANGNYRHSGRPLHAKAANTLVKLAKELMVEAKGNA
jgi:hypothetical protein